MLRLRTVLLILITLMFAAALVIKLISLTTPVSSRQVAPSANTRQQVPPPSDVPYAASFKGEYVCLPHTDTKGPQTLECALGLKMDNGAYIALDFGDKPVSYGMGERLELRGMLVPIEQISTDMWRKYPITGILRVTDDKRL